MLSCPLSRVPLVSFDKNTGRRAPTVQLRLHLLRARRFCLRLQGNVSSSAHRLRLMLCVDNLEFVAIKIL